ncbi:hypothetical protein [Shewanella mangrovi]|uniref:hypothetical protein n=1 Tax=Shewanella mangrovi TaxID=1515746 RepID=UPI0012E04773|nr:hypothetical protein [Shewanella mangrovi]
MSLIVVVFLAWWLMHSAPVVGPQSAMSEIETSVEAATSSNASVAKDVAQAAVPTIEERRALVSQCWQDSIPQPSDFGNDELLVALLNTLDNGTPYELLLQQVPAEDAANYQMQLMRAWRYQQLLAMGYTDDGADDTDSDNAYLSSLSEQQRKMMRVEDNAGKDYYQFSDQLKPLLALDDAQFSAQIAEMSLTSGQFVSLMLNGIPYNKLALLLEHVPAPALSSQPVVVNFSSSTPFMNIADYAAYELDVPMLKLLAEHGVTPTQTDGLIGPIERALLHRRMGKDDIQNTLATVQYLVENGYKVALTTTENGQYFGSGLLNMQWLNVADEVTDYLLSQQATYPAMTTFPVEANTEIKAALDAQADRMAALVKQREQCQQLADQQLDTEGLLSPAQVNGLINDLSAKYQGEALLDALQTEDPAFVAIYQQRNWGASRGAHEKQLRDAMLGTFVVNSLTELLQSTALDSVDTSIVLMQLIRNPELLEAWNSRLQPVLPESLAALSYATPEKLQALVEQGFDLHQQDVHGGNLYSVFFSNAPDKVQWLLTEQVDPFSNRYGPDGLDYALDKSYADNQLFEGTKQILQACLSLEPNHLRRIARLKKFRPELYQQLLTLDPTLKVADDITPNVVLSINM